MSNLTTRILVAVVGIPLVLLLTLAGGFYFFGLIALISTLALHEYYGLAMAKGARPQIAVGALFGLCVTWMFMQLKYEMVLIAFVIFIPLILVVELFRNNGSALSNTAATLAGVCYVSICLGSIIGVRELPALSGEPNAGGYMVIAVFASIWFCDSAAYFAGRSFGKHKLFERVSPNKTWEGAIAGFVAAIVAFVVARSFGLPFLTLSDAVVCGCIVGVFGQLGDMVESLLKRDACVKDSSAIIPGHGGVLDRFDSLIVVSPLIFFYLNFTV